MSQKIIDVKIGEIKIAKKGEILKTILGSCVCIGIIWKEKKNCRLITQSTATSRNKNIRNRRKICRSSNSKLACAYENKPS